MRRFLALLLVVFLMISFATVVFAAEPTKAPSPTGDAENDPDKPKDNESPRTGDFALMLVPVLLLGLFGVVVSTKKLVKNH